MKILYALACALFVATLSGCGVGYGGGYYESNVEYGGWGPGYRVGPGRRGDRREDHGGGAPHAYRSAPEGRSAPSLPSGGRGGGHSGGGHGR